MRKFLTTLLLALSFSALGQVTNAPALLGQKGLTPPTNCQIGQLFFDTDATAGSNIYGCTALNTWTAQGGSSSTLTGPVTINEAIGSSALTLTGATQVASFPVFSATQTWNNAGVTFTGLKLNITNTASAAASTPFDFQVGGVSLFKMNVAGTQFTLGGAHPKIGDGQSSIQFGPFNGEIMLGGAGLTSQAYSYITGSGTEIPAGQYFGWSSTSDPTATADTFLTRPAAATIQLGNAAAASPVAQTLQVQGSRPATDNNVGGASLTITSGNGTGTGTISTLTFQSPVAVGSGTGAQTQTTGLRVNKGVYVSTGYAVASLPATPLTGSRAHVTDQITGCPANGAAVTAGGAFVCPVFYNGSAWVGG